MAFAISLMGFALAALLPHDPASPLRDNDLYQWVSGISQFLHAIAIVTLAGVVAFDVILKSIRLNPPGILRDLLLAVAYIAAGVFVLSKMGVNVAGIVTASAVVTAVIGFSLQDTLGNVMGGMAMQLERTVAVGDWIQVDKTIGIVREIRWRQTSIETRIGDTVVIPNSVLTKNQVIVLGKQWGSHTAHRQHLQYIFFYVDYRFAPTEVIGAVESALHVERLTGVADQPAAHCLLWSLKDSLAEYAVRYWLTDLTDDEAVDSVIRSRVFFALRRAHIAPSMPAIAQFVTQDNHERHQRKRAEQVEERLESLQDVELFQPLTLEERRELAARLRLAPFAKGEAMCRQGDAAHWLYILCRGDADVRLNVDGTSKTIAALHRGNFFGEMGLMTGAPRAADVIATTDTVCYRLDKAQLMEILQKRPEIAEGISLILARRRVELDAAKEHLTEEALKQRLQSTQGDLLARIRNFFTLT
jgi:CRP-like cAMP-binding protein